MNKFLKKVQILRDFESGLHHGDPNEDPYEEADKRRMEYLNALTKAPRCRVCGARLNAPLEDPSNPLTVCGKCGGRKAQVRLEQQDRIKATSDIEQGHPRGAPVPTESGKSSTRKSGDGLERERTALKRGEPSSERAGSEKTSG